MRLFQDRADAGRQLASRLTRYKAEAPLVLGLPRGGVSVAYEVAAALGAPLDVWVVRKLGAPGYPELGVGAVAEGGIVYLNRSMVQEVGATDEEIRDVIQQESAEVTRRVKTFRRGRPAPMLEGRNIILVDDGIATGGTLQAALHALKATRPRKIVLAVPVASSQALESLSRLVDETVCVHATPELYAIGAWYEDFHQVPDEDVIHLLELSHEPHESEQEVAIPVEEGVTLRGTLSGPVSPGGLVLFAHGSGSSRFSPRNRRVAAALHEYGLATLLFDLLTTEEELLDEETGEFRFDIDLLALRLVEASDWAARAYGAPLGYFGSSTGAAAALIAAAERPSQVGAVVSRGGRPDLAWESLPQVRAPTLLIVGGNDTQVLTLNRRAYTQLRSRKRLEVVPGATHLFEEPGALEEVARLAGEWFQEQLGRRAPAVVSFTPEGAPGS